MALRPSFCLKETQNTEIQGDLSYLFLTHSAGCSAYHLRQSVLHMVWWKAKSDEGGGLFLCISLNFSVPFQFSKFPLYLVVVPQAFSGKVLHQDLCTFVPCAQNPETRLPHLTRSFLWWHLLNGACPTLESLPCSTISLQIFLTFQCTHNLLYYVYYLFSIFPFSLLLEYKLHEDQEVLYLFSPLTSPRGLELFLAQGRHSMSKCWINLSFNILLSPILYKVIAYLLLSK